jgi:NAD(P)H-hydrate epimerase
MQPVVSVEEMKTFDAAALGTTEQSALIRRAGMAVGFAILKRFEGVSGTRIVVIAGPGSNGADGRVAGTMLERRGAFVTVVAPDAKPAAFLDAEIVIDAAFGTGLSRSYTAPTIPGDVPVVAVDVPSGLDGDTGALLGTPLQATLTVTMAAVKQGLLLGHGPGLCGEIVVAEIGIPVENPRSVVIDDADCAAIPERSRGANKWSAGVCIVAGSPGMEGAGALCSLGAMRAGSGMVRLVTVNEIGSSTLWPRDVVRREVFRNEIVPVALEESTRTKAMVIGPGLGLDEQTAAAIRELLIHRTGPVILDADGITAVQNTTILRDLVAAAPHPVMITPHDGELARLLGHDLAVDRRSTIQSLADETGVIVLSKGATTLVVTPMSLAQPVYFVTSGTPALATAGTGDVLGGVIAALAAQGVPLPLAGALGAFFHGKASAYAPGTLVASDLPNLVGDVMKEVVR